MSSYGFAHAIEQTLRVDREKPAVTQERIDQLNARLTPEDIAAVASDWQAVGDDMRRAIDAELAKERGE